VLVMAEPPAAGGEHPHGLAHDPHDLDDIALPALMRAARGTYANAIRGHLAARGLDDLPRNGAFVLGGMANRAGSAGDMVRGLGITKQAASQLIETLVARGYLVREPHPDDRRRTVVQLTERGREAARATAAGVDDVDTELVQMITAEQLAGLRAGLHALAHIKHEMAGEPDEP